MWNPFSRKKDNRDQTLQVHIPIAPDKVEKIAGKLRFSKEWFCSCGARLRIRGDKNRDFGPSNYQGIFSSGYPDEKLRGHSIVPPEILNWNGLAEERGWITNPEVKCPACILGLSVEEYKKLKRK